MANIDEVVVVTRKLKIGKEYKNRGEQIKNWRFFKRRNKNALLSLGWVVKLPSKLYNQLQQEDRLLDIIANESKLENEIKEFMKEQEEKEETSTEADTEVDIEEGNDKKGEVDEREEGDE